MYEKPANKYVAGFIGSPSMDFVDAKIVGEGSEIFVQALRI